MLYLCSIKISVEFIQLKIMITAALIGAGASIIGNVLQRNAQERAYKRQQEQLDATRARETAHYNRRYYEDGTQRADTQRALTQAREALLKSNRAAMGSNAVMGGTNAQAAAAKEASNNAYANAVASAAAGAERRKDIVDQNYQTRMDALDAQQMSLDAANDQANAQAIGDAANQVGQLAQSAVAAEMSAPAKNAVATGGAVSATAPAQNTTAAVVEPSKWGMLAGENAISTPAQTGSGVAANLAKLQAENANLTGAVTDKVSQFYGDQKKRLSNILMGS